jgi:hypothetical protein
VALLLPQVQLLDERSLRKMLNALDKRVRGSGSSSSSNSGTIYGHSQRVEQHQQHLLKWQMRASPM